MSKKKKIQPKPGDLVKPAEPRGMDDTRGWIYWGATEFGRDQPKTALYINQVGEKHLVLMEERVIELSPNQRFEIISHVEDTTPEPEPLPEVTDGDEWFCVAAIGNEGVEMLVSSQDQDEAQKQLPFWKLRARFNAHRHIEIYAWLDDHQVDWDEAEKRKAEIIKGAKNVPW